MAEQQARLDDCDERGRVERERERIPRACLRRTPCQQREQQEATADDAADLHRAVCVVENTMHCAWVDDVLRFSAPSFCVACIYVAHDMSALILFLGD